MKRVLILLTVVFSLSSVFGQSDRILLKTDINHSFTFSNYGVDNLWYSVTVNTTPKGFYYCVIGSEFDEPLTGVVDTGFVNGDFLGFEFNLYNVKSGFLFNPKNAKSVLVFNIDSKAPNMVQLPFLRNKIESQNDSFGLESLLPLLKLFL